MITSSWTLMAAGFVFCILGVYLFFRNIYEDGKSIQGPAFVIIAGVIMITIATAKFYHLVK